MPESPPTGTASTVPSGIGGSTPAVSSLGSNGQGPPGSLPQWEHHVKLGRQFLAQGDLAGADREYRAAVAESEAAGGDSPHYASALSNLGQLRYQQKKFADAVDLFRRALEVREKLVGAEHHSLVQSINNLAAANVALTDLAAAEPLLHRALVLTERHYGAEHQDVATCLSNLSRLYFRRGAYAQAEPYLQRLLSIKQAAQGEDHPEVGGVLANLATVRQMLGQYDSAEELWRRVLTIRERSLSPNAPALATTLENLADTCAAGGNVDEALQLRERALAIHEQMLPADHPTVVSARAKIVGLQLESSMDAFDGTHGDMFVPVGPTTPRPSPWVPTVRPSGDGGPRMFGEVDARAHADPPPAVVVPQRPTAPAQPQITAESLSALLSEVESEHQQQAPRSPIAAGAMVMRDFARSMLGGRRRSEPEAVAPAVDAAPAAAAAVVQSAPAPAPAAAPAPAPIQPATMAMATAMATAMALPAAEPAPRRDLPIMLPEARAELALREPDARMPALADEWSAEETSLTHDDAALVSGGKRKAGLIAAGLLTVSVGVVLAVSGMGKGSRVADAEIVPSAPATAQNSGKPVVSVPLGADSLMAQTRTPAPSAAADTGTSTTVAATPVREEREEREERRESAASTRGATASSRQDDSRNRADSALVAPKSMSAMETIRTAVDLIHVSYQIDSAAASRVDTILNPTTKAPVSFKKQPIAPRPR